MRYFVCCVLPHSPPPSSHHHHHHLKIPVHETLVHTEICPSYSLYLIKRYLDYSVLVAIIHSIQCSHFSDLFIEYPICVHSVVSLVELSNNPHTTLFSIRTFIHLYKATRRD